MSISPSGIPTAENFSFTFNTLLSDVASLCPEYRDEIFLAQTDLLLSLANEVREAHGRANASEEEETGEEETEGDEVKAKRKQLPQNTKREGLKSIDFNINFHSIMVNLNSTLTFTLD